MPGVDAIYDLLTKGGYGLATLFLIWGLLNRKERISVQKQKDEQSITFQRKIIELNKRHNEEKDELQKSVLDLATSHYTNSIVNINELKNTVASMKDAIGEMVRYVMSTTHR